jgi:hypothetical protein
MNDTLEYMKLDPIYRQYHHNELTFSMVYAYSENYVLPLSHDEVVHGKGSLLNKMPGDEWRKFAGLRALLGYMWAHPGKQLLFMGGEFGQGSEWSESEGLDWWVLQFDVHAGVQRLVRDLNSLYRASPAIWSQDTSPDGFGWIDSNDAHGNVLSFLRFGSQEHGVPVLACVANFSPMPHTQYQLGLPLAGRWREVLNTDAAEYGGSGMGNMGMVHAVPKPWHGRPASATMVVPPLGAVWLTPDLLSCRTEKAEEPAWADCCGACGCAAAAQLAIGGYHQARASLRPLGCLPDDLVVTRAWRVNHVYGWRFVGVVRVACRGGGGSGWGVSGWDGSGWDGSGAGLTLHDEDPGEGCWARSVRLGWGVCVGAEVFGELVFGDAAGG